MANQEQLDILKQGVGIWNKWRKENITVQINLSLVDLNHTSLNNILLMTADLSNAVLERADLSDANLVGANLSSANLKRVILERANLNGSNLEGTNLSNAKLGFTKIKETNLKGSNLEGSDLIQSDLSLSDLSRANLRETNLSQSNLIGTNLIGSDLEGALMSNTILGSIDLSETYGLEDVRHFSPSLIGADTIRLSKGKIPGKFLRGCGLSDIEVESAKLFTPDLTNEEIVKIQYRIYDLRATQAIQISPLFISYSHGDTAFVDRLENALNEKGVRFWRDIHDMTVGKMETQIDRAIRQNPTVLLILSRNSINSDWVQHEVRKARELEKELGRDTLCPITLDDKWKSSRWPERIMEQVMEYNILDFSKWEDESTFQAKFTKLLSGLDLFYKKPEK